MTVTGEAEVKVVPDEVVVVFGVESIHKELGRVRLDACLEHVTPSHFSFLHQRLRGFDTGLTNMH